MIITPLKFNSSSLTQMTNRIGKCESTTTETMSKPKILISAGGTGGHIYPAQAMVEMLQDKAEILYLEKKIVSSPKNIFKLGYGFLQSLAILLKFRPRLVIVTGGYPAVPIGLATVFLHIPLVLQEQNAFLGKTNRFLARFAKDVIYETPVRREIADVYAKAPLENRDTLLIFGGSQGAQSINKAVEKIDLSEIKVVHIVGRSTDSIPPSPCDSMERGASGVRLEFVNDMASLYAKTRLAVCRAGGSTLAELAACGIPAILIPYPFAAENHQQANAEKYEKASAAVICSSERGSPLSPEALERIIKSLFFDSQKLESMSKQMRILAASQNEEILWTRLRKII